MGPAAPIQPCWQPVPASSSLSPQGRSLGLCAGHAPHLSVSAEQLPTHPLGRPQMECHLRGTGIARRGGYCLLPSDGNSQKDSRVPAESTASKSQASAAQGSHPRELEPPALRHCLHCALQEKLCPHHSASWPGQEPRLKPERWPCGLNAHSMSTMGPDV